MRRGSIRHPNQQEDLDENDNVENTGNQLIVMGLPPSRSFSNFMNPPCSDSTMCMSSRPSFISLMLIASDEEFSRLPRLPAPLQVESDTYQKCGWEDEPKVCSHLPVLHPPSESEDESEMHGGILQSIAHLPGRIRKISADKHRFNVYALPDEEREQLKNLYVY